MLYIMRHGRTDWNEEKRLQGRTDIPLNENGRKMAEAAHEEYKNLHLDECFCSPLQRARETAEIVLAGRDIPIIIDDRLKEMGFGEYEGLKEVYNKPEYNVHTLFVSPETYIADKGAESIEDLFKRNREFLDEVIAPELKAGKDILIVAHGAVNSGLITTFKGLPTKDFWSAGLAQCRILKLER